MKKGITKGIVLPNGFRMIGDIPVSVLKAVSVITTHQQSLRRCYYSGDYFGKSEKLHRRQRWEIGSNKSPVMGW